VLTLALALLAVAPAAALADGDPGSDVLLLQNLFTASDSGVSVAQQLQLGRLLDATTTAGAPVRVAIISRKDDLGSVESLWNEPQTYAEYLGLELGDTYGGRLLIVMPDGYGVYWHANPGAATKLEQALGGRKPVSGQAASMTAATITAVDRIESSAGIGSAKLARLESASRSGVGAGASSSSSAPVARSGTAAAASQSTASSSSTSRHKVPTGLLLVVIVVLLLLYVGWRSGALKGLRGRMALALAKRSAGESRARRPLRVRPIALLPTLLLAIVVVALVINHTGSQNVISSKVALATNPHLDPGTTLAARAAPGFDLTNQTGQPISLKQYRGKVVILAFIDAECQTICPLTSTAMLDAKAALGTAGKQVQLLAVDANWKSAQVEDVQNYTQLHGMTGQWNFLTGSLPDLRQVWKHYGIDEEAFESKDSNTIDHVAALYVIDPQGRIRKSYTTYPSYASVPQMGQLLARSASQLLPGHPPVHTHYSYAERPETRPTVTTSVPKLGGGSVKLGPGKPHLYLFFATWDRQTTRIAAELDTLNAYQSVARSRGLPTLTAVDEGSVEPSAGALPDFVRTLAHPLSYPVAIDTTGSVGDGYQVEGEPWFVLTNSAGEIVWYQEIYTEGWPTLKHLDQEVANDLSSKPSKAPSVKRSEDELAGSPAPLAALHAQASKLLPGGQSALDARIKRLTSRGYSVVLNIWASWCGPCQAEFGLFSRASVQYGKKVAFLGADFKDSSADAQVFLNDHHVSYPSYAATAQSIQKILVGGVEATPTTVFISPQDKILYPHTGQYESQGALDSDVQDYALGPSA
jgi:cytochrome c biogenesis protein CcmG/thiol:disulfide interchange protein DsbE